jgi:hypothetical protein
MLTGQVPWAAISGIDPALARLETLLELAGPNNSRLYGLADVLTGLRR